MTCAAGAVSEKSESLLWKEVDVEGFEKLDLDFLKSRIWGTKGLLSRSITRTMEEISEGLRKEHLEEGDAMYYLGLVRGLRRALGCLMLTDTNTDPEIEALIAGLDEVDAKIVAIVEALVQRDVEFARLERLEFVSEIL
jgi:hypothetical protein